MKKCSRCGIEKELGDFFVKDSKNMRLHAQCKLCYKAHRSLYSAQHYIKYGDKYRERARNRRRIVKTALRNQMLDYLSNKSCVICGENDIRVLDFDHLDPVQKAFGISDAINNGLRWEEILKEMQKCRILCANCHRKHTAEQQSWYR